MHLTSPLRWNVYGPAPSEDMWDLVVIGTGGAAMAAGIEARSRGKQVLLVEHGPLGGRA